MEYDGAVMFSRAHRHRSLFSAVSLLVVLVGVALAVVP
jgi:hypothetical protein